MPLWRNAFPIILAGKTTSMKLFRELIKVAVLVQWQVGSWLFLICNVSPLIPTNLFSKINNDVKLKSKRVFSESKGSNFIITCFPFLGSNIACKQCLNGTHILRREGVDEFGNLFIYSGAYNPYSS